MTSSNSHVAPSHAGQGRHTVVVMQRVGRLGNQIGLLANLIALSMATGVRVCHPALGSYANYFKGTTGSLFCCYPSSLSDRRSPPSSLLRASMHKICRLLDRSGILRLAMPGRTFASDYQSLVDMTQPSFSAILRGGKVTFLTKGWFFRYPRVSKTNFLEEVRNFFALAEPYASNVERILKRARAGCDILIGVHIRQTDFKGHAKGRYYFRTEDYARLMMNCQRLFAPAEVGFLVVSDEPHEASDFPLLHCYFSSGIDIEDMYCLGGCDYIVGSAASSFSLWPAVLFQKPTYRIFEAAHEPSAVDFKTTLEPWVDLDFAQQPEAS
jgi:hypothetical protein